MLKRLHVRNLALAENITVEFEPGFNVITGETGAGKSILIGALALVLGERADKSLIRTGEDTCSAEAVFDASGAPGAAGALEELGLPPAEEGELVFRRTLKATGGQCLLNDSPVTAQTLRRLGAELVDLHGPHDHQSLFDPDAQLAILDDFGRHSRERAAYAEVHRRILDLERQRAELTAGETDVASQLAWLREHVKEIEDAQLAEGEEEAVRQEQATVGQAQRILELAGQIAGALTEGEAAAFPALASTHRPLEELVRLLPAAKEWRAEIEGVTSRLQEISAALSRAADAIDANPSRLDWLDQRLATYQRLHRKYGATVADIQGALDADRQRLRDVETRGQRLAALEQEHAAQVRDRERLGLTLRKKRAAAADELAEAITGELEFLGFPGSAFTIALQPAEPRTDGLDEVEFGFAPNVGEAMRPLRQIASSGEISRVMLATKAVLAEQDRIPLLVFDEIDANLGGEMGHAVGRELAGVAARHQVICITHLPQVAAYGATHFAVTKAVRDGRTVSRVDRLGDGDRVAEIARMLGGDAASRATREHAAEMLAAARRKKP